MATDPANDKDALSLGLALVVAGLGRLAFWAPVFLALAFLAQVGLRGLRPALAEERRLAAEAEALRATHEGLLDEELLLERQLEALDDPIYMERQRRNGLWRTDRPIQVDSPTPFSDPGRHAGGGPPVSSDSSSSGSSSDSASGSRPGVR